MRDTNNRKKFEHSVVEEWTNLEIAGILIQDNGSRKRERKFNKGDHNMKSLI